MSETHLKTRRILALFFSVLLLAGCGKETENTGAPGPGTDEKPQMTIVVDSAVPEEDHTDELAAALLSQMTVREKITQMILPAIRSIGEGDAAEPVLTLKDPLTDVFRQNAFCGVILYAQNLNDSEQTVSLINALQDANREGGAKSGLLIAVDQEGGAVTRIAGGTGMCGNMALAATGDPGNAKTAACVIGDELSSLGFNVDFAPVLDINCNPANPVIGVRSFSDDPQTVKEYGTAFLSGLHESGILTALKHFPGHGDTDTDSHTGLPLVDRSEEELTDRELVPFSAALQDTDMVMTAHIRFPQIETETYTSVETGETISLPATLSKKILTDLLRDRLHYEGVIVTDAMEMDAIEKHFDPMDAAGLAITAGADILLMPMPVRTPEEIEAMNAYIEGIAGMVEDGTIPPERIDDAVTRILKMKIRGGLIEASDPADPDTLRIPVLHADPKEAQATVGSAGHLDTQWQIAKEAVTLIKNNGAVPVNAAAKTVIAYPAESMQEAVETGLLKLREEGLENGENITAVCYQDLTAEKAEGILDGADTLIAVSALRSAAELDPGSSSGKKTAFLDALFAAAKKNGLPSVLISARLPYDVARYESADAAIACYMDGINLSAALASSFGLFDPQGTLPVSVPEIKEDYTFGTKVLYPRGFPKPLSKSQDVVLGDEQFDAYLPLLAGKKVALFSNQSGIVGDLSSDDGTVPDGTDVSLIPFGTDGSGNPVSYGPHLLDELLSRGISVEAIFTPEHGFRGTSDAGSGDSADVDPKTGVPILPLYENGRNGSPSAQETDLFDVLLVDIQDVGLRYYTYHITLLHLMDACAKAGKKVIILDRPNPNGFYVDGPILQDGFHSGVGALPIPVVHGMTLGELAQMINGEGWLDAGKNSCDLTVIPCKNYTHADRYRLLRAPSPNLKDMRAVYLYASTCFFENTVVSVGRGTPHPFEIYGTPYLEGDPAHDFSFTPKSLEGAKNPPFEGKACYGADLRDIPLDRILSGGVDPTYLIDAYTAVMATHPEVDFFGTADKQGRYFADLLSGSDALRRMITEGRSAEEIRASWQPEVSAFCEKRKPYLLYD